MQTLTEISSAANFADAHSAARALAYARRFTRRFQEVETLPVASREAAMLAVQFPACLQSPQDGDLFYGRILLPCVGLGPEPGGLGYWFDFAGVESFLQKEGQDRESWQELIHFWQTRTTQARTRAAYPEQVASRLPSDAWTEESGVGFPLYRIAGLVPDFSRLLRLGLDGLEQEAGRMGGDFGSGAVQAIEILRTSIDEGLRVSPPDMAPSLLAVRHEPPSTLREAIQLFWLYVLHSGVWSYGRLDVVFGPYLEADLAKGTLDEEGAIELLCGLWRMMHAYANQYNNRVVIGGMGRPDEACADRLALLAIEATRRVRLNQPQLTLRFYKGQNPALWDAAITAIGEGCTFPMLYNDEVNVPSVMEAFHIPREEARDYFPYGCGEYVMAGKGVGSPNGVINLLKALEVALHGGVDPVTRNLLVPGLPGVEAISNFEQLWQSYARVVEFYVEVLAQQQAIENQVTSQEIAFLYASLLMDDCVIKGRPLLDGGARYLGGTLETYGNTNAADSLLALREMVFHRNQVSLPDFVQALDENFVGHQSLRELCVRTAKYGNDEALADDMARRVHDHICRVTQEQATQVGLDYYLVVIINNWANTVLGWKTGASADGRLSGQPMANGNNPSPGSDLNGPSAFLNSLARLNPRLHAGAVQNMKFSKEWFGPMRPKFEALLQAYFVGGGTQAMITVVSREDLEAAMREPAQWGHLMVRVGGFSIRFVELPHEAQLEVLARTLH